jgi:hypothetical protein
LRAPANCGGRKTAWPREKRQKPPQQVQHISQPDMYTTRYALLASRIKKKNFEKAEFHSIDLNQQNFLNFPKKIP